MKDNGNKKDGPEAGYIEPIGDRKPALKRKARTRTISSSVASVTRPETRSSGGRKKMIGGSGKGYGLKMKKSTYMTKKGLERVRATSKAAYDKLKSEYQDTPKITKKNR
jgi:hypothetical protein